MAAAQPIVRINRYSGRRRDVASGEEVAVTPPPYPTFGAVSLAAFYTAGSYCGRSNPVMAFLDDRGGSGQRRCAAH